jgi:hypothetical protein
VGPFRSESGQSQLSLTAINLHVIRLGDGKPRTDPMAPIAELLMKDDSDPWKAIFRLCASPETL